MRRIHLLLPSLLFIVLLASACGNSPAVFTPNNPQAAQAHSALVILTTAQGPINSSFNTLNSDSKGAISAQTVQSGSLAGLSLQEVQKKGDDEIYKRVHGLSDLQNSVANDPVLTASNRANTGAVITADMQNLSTLQDKLNSETTLAGATMDYSQIASDIRLYSNTILAIDGDRADDSIQMFCTTQLTGTTASLQEAVDQATKKGVITTKAITALADFKVQTKNACGLPPANANEILNTAAQTGYPTNKTNVENAIATLKGAYTAFGKAVADASDIVSVLQANQTVANPASPSPSIKATPKPSPKPSAKPTATPTKKP